MSEQGVATNRLTAASRKFHGNYTNNLEIGARRQPACGSTLTLDLKNEAATLHSSKFIMKSLHLLLFAVSATLCLAEETKLNVDEPATLKGILAEAIDYEDLDYGDGENEDLLYAPGKKTPYTGWAKLMSKKGQVENLEHYKDGKQHGLEIMWYENGQKYSEINYRDGKKHGLQNLWYENGQKESELTRKDGEFHGPVTKWWENGNMCYSKNYLDGEYHGLSTEWHENGQKKNETNYKDGEKNGLQTWWDNDGNVIRQSRWKIGREVEIIK
jgi:antitoxin component YwqK of YwqJK toxin-antitoxin module